MSQEDDSVCFYMFSCNRIYCSFFLYSKISLHLQYAMDSIHSRLFKKWEIGNKTAIINILEHYMSNQSQHLWTSI